MDAKEFIRAEYTEGNEGGTILRIHIGHQSFALSEVFDEPKTAKHSTAKWYFQQIKLALKNYAEQEKKKLLEVSDDEIKENFRIDENRSNSQRLACVFGAKWMLNHLKEK